MNKRKAPGGIQSIKRESGERKRARHRETDRASKRQTELWRDRQSYRETDRDIEDRQS